MTQPGLGSMLSGSILSLKHGFKPTLLEMAWLRQPVSPPLTLRARKAFILIPQAVRPPLTGVRVVLNLASARGPQSHFEWGHE